MVPKRVRTISLVVLSLVVLLTAATSVSFSQANAPDRSTDASEVFLPLVVHHWPPLVRVLPNHFGYVDKYGNARVLGEVENGSPDQIKYVDVSVTLLDDVGQALATEEGSVWLDSLAPGEKSCFSTRFSNPPAGVASYDLGAPTYSKRDEPLPKLTIYDDQGSYDASDGEYRIEGKLRNDGSSRVTTLQVIATSYNAAGKVVGCGFTYPTSTELNPGESTDFVRIETGRDYADVASYRLQADGDVE